ncbi:MAG: Uma2 family endonuclease, partial [bacterium]|nr:Uma2 family endonuclease [bacterium]
MAEAALAFERPPEEIEYPESDGEPMAETDEHRDDLAEIVFTLKRFFRDRGDVYVSGNLFVYSEQGDPKACRAPEVFVVFGVKPDQRRTYRKWEEGGKMPAVAIELTSKKTKKEDQVDKPALYAGWGIEYTFLYDVLGDYLKPPLQGMRLGGDGRYRSLVGPGTGPLPCPPLGL